LRRGWRLHPRLFAADSLESRPPSAP
jgi:hypothetical protein